MCQLVKCVEFEIRSYVATFVRFDLPVSFTLPNGQNCDQGRMVYNNSHGHGRQMFSGQCKSDTLKLFRTNMHDRDGGKSVKNFHIMQ
jgi:hypothetical protein